MAEPLKPRSPFTIILKTRLSGKNCFGTLHSQLNMQSNRVDIDSIVNRIYFLRGEKVMLDVDLARLYQVETRVLNQAVRRNIYRFPQDFLFELTREEFVNLKSQFVTSSSGIEGMRWGGRRKLPLAFTEQGVAMLSGILKSKRATNMVIMRTFVALRKWMQTNKELASKIKQLENKYDQQFKVVFDAIRQLIKEEKEVRPIGFRTTR